MQRRIVLPAKLAVLAAVFYRLFFSRWMLGVAESKADVLLTLQQLTVGYVFFTVGQAALLLRARRFSLRWVPRLVFAVGVADGLFLAGMLLVTGGFESSVFWAFAGLIILNALSLPLSAPQIILNLSLSAFYMTAGIISEEIVMKAGLPNSIPPVAQLELQPPRRVRPHKSAGALAAEQAAVAAESQRMDPLLLSETSLLHVIVLWLLTVCCYGVQILAARQKNIEEEAREFAARQGQLRAAGRLAAEIAHQIKNPLAIINNAAFSLRRMIAGGKTDVADQIRIIQEEVERSDRILTELMDYARLSEGRVEKLDAVAELDRALAEVFPSAIGYEVQVERDYAPDLPPLLMQRGHLTTILVNLLQNARESLNGRGHVRVGVRTGPDASVEISVQDDGPGIPAEQSERIFEAYFTTKEKGTGLGLAIVKHNVDLYGGTVRVESALGKGARFVLMFPAKTLVVSPQDV